MAALDFPASPGFGQSHVQNGSAWQWDNEKWKVNVLGTYLPLLGGTMLGPMTLAGDAVNPLDPVPMRQVAALTAQYLLLTGGNVTGPTTIMGAQFTAKKNLMINMPEPPNMSTATTTDGGSIRAWYVTANNYMFSTYYDGASFRRLNATDTPSQLSAAGGTLNYQAATAIGAANTTVTLNSVFTVNSAGQGYFSGNLGVWQGNLAGTQTGLVSANDLIVRNAVGHNLYYDGTTWRYRAAGSGGLMHMDTSVAPSINFYTAPNAGAGAAASLTGAFSITPGGVYVAAHLYVSNYNSFEWSLYTDGSGHHIQNHRAGWYELWNTTNGTWSWNSPSGQRMALDGNATLTVNGYLFGASNGRVDGSWTAGSSIISYNGRLVAQGGGNGSLTAYCTNSGYAFGIYVDAATLNFCQSYGDGTPYRYLAQINVNGDFNTGGAGTFGYLHSTGTTDTDGTVNGAYIHSRQDIRADSWVYCNVLHSNQGVFRVGEGYQISRDPNNGTWVFYENWTWNFQVRTSGDTESRGTHYCDGHLFSLNNVYAGNAWDFYFGRGASGKLFQFQGNWYWDWNISNGNLRWVAGGNVMLEMFPGYDNQWGHYFPCYNRNGAFVGFGSLTFMERGSALRSHARSPHALDAVMKIDAVRYQRRTKRRVQEGEIVVPDHEFQPEIGFLAEDVADIIPEAANVAADPKETVGTVNPLALTAVLWMAVKELAAEVKALKGSAA